MNKISDNFKMGLNRLQTRLVESPESDNVLLIFDKEFQKEFYKKMLIKKHKNTPDKILKTIDEILSPTGLSGLRFKRYWFMTDDDMQELERL